MRHKQLHESDGQRTCAVVLETGEEVKSAAHLRKRKDRETGLALIRPDI